MELLTLDLQLLAEGAAAAPAAAASNGGEAAAPQGVNEGDAGSEESQEDIDKEFGDAIRGKYKDAFSKATSAIVRDRVKKSKAAIAEKEQENARLRADLADICDQFDVDDVQALKAVLAAEHKEKDEEEGLRRGLSPEDISNERAAKIELRKTKREKEELEARIAAIEREKSDNRRYAGWRAEARLLANTFPSLDFDEEMNNEKFVRLLDGGASVQDAYVACHTKEVLSEVMQHAAQRGAEVTANRFAENARRPVEGMISKGGSGAGHASPADMTYEERQAIIKRVQKGEVIRF